MKLDKKAFDKWVRWIENIKFDLTQLVINQQINIGFIEIVNSNYEHIKTNEGLLFCKYICNNYGLYAVVTIRRHIKSNKDSISLIRLLEEIIGCSDRLTYEYYLEYYPLSLGYCGWQKPTFNKLSKDGKVISKELIEKDIIQLKKAGKILSNFVDRKVAHLDKRGYDKKITYGEINRAIDIFNKITCKYYTFLTSKGYTTLAPTIQSNWQQIFKVPLDVRKDKSN